MFDIKVIIGSSFGDEGKGLMTDYFAAVAQERSEKCLVVLSNGSAQRGHTVQLPNGIRHVFHHFGSGTFACADTYIPEYFIINPMSFAKEFRELSDIGFRRKVFVSKLCKVATPFDMIANQIFEENRGENRHGSCGMGVWETELRYMTDEWQYLYWSYVEQSLRRDDYLKWMILEIKEYYEERFELNNVKMSDKWREIWDCDELVDHFVEDIKFFAANTTEIKRDENIFKEYDTIIFENAQGLCLDQNFCKEDSRYTTPSNTGLKNPYEMIKKYFDAKETNVEVCYITRTYLTRHGAGPLPGECDKSEIKSNMVDLTNVPNPFQGTLRYGKIDPEALMKRVNKDFSIATNGWKKSLAITHVNEYPWNFPEIYHEFDNVYESEGMTREDVIKKQIVF